MQLCVLGIIKSSSAWTLARLVEERLVLVGSFGRQDLAVGVHLFAELTWTENKE